MGDTTCWVVLGKTGAHSDEETWVARAFAGQVEAAEFAARLNKKLIEAGMHEDTIGCDERADFPFDANFRLDEDPMLPRVDYTGASYSVAEVPWGAVREEASDG